MVHEIEVRTKTTGVMTANQLRSSVTKALIDHVGRDNYVTQAELFRKVYGDPGQYSDVEIYFLWERIRRAMHELRKESYCFVISKRVGNSRGYFVIKDKEDADIYKTEQANNIRKALNLIEKAYKAVEEKHWEKLQLGQDVSLPEVSKQIVIGHDEI